MSSIPSATSAPIGGQYPLHADNARPPSPPAQPLPAPGRGAARVPAHAPGRRDLLLKNASTAEPGASSAPRVATGASRSEQAASTDRGDGPPRAALNDAIKQFIKKDAGPKLFRHRPEGVKSADALLRPLQDKAQLTRRDQLGLIDASAHLQEALAAKPGDYPSAAALVGRIDRFVGSAGELHQAVAQLAGKLEEQAVVLTFSRYMQENHPTMVTGGHDGGELTLTEEGRKHYPMLKQQFDMTALDRHVVPTSSKLLSARDVAVIKIIDSGYRDYQKALRHPDETMQTRRRLLESAEIVTQLAKAKPEEVKKERMATVFPGGISDPSQLEPGKIYKEDGFVFVGGERGADQGHRMRIKMSKGYPVDARQYYGHSMKNENKLQWISLPGAQFRFDGVDEQHGKPTYLFSQISR